MAGVGVPVVVDLYFILVLFCLVVGIGAGDGVTYSVQKSVTLDLRGTAGGLVDVVTLHGDEVARAVKVDTPVVVAVTGGGVVAGAVDEAVGDGHALGGVGAEDDVLATDAGGGDVVNPDHVGVVEGDGVSTPDVLGVDVGDGDVPVCLLVIWSRYLGVWSSLTG